MQTEDKTENKIETGSAGDAPMEWWECTCGFKNALHMKFCGQCGSTRSEKREPGVPLFRLDIGCGVNRKFDTDGKGNRLKEGDDGYCGEWTGVDSIAFDGVDVVVDLCERVYEWREDGRFLTNARAMKTATQAVGPVSGDDSEPVSYPMYSKVHVGYKPWPWEDNSVDAIHCSHFLEHFGGWDRVHIFNEMYRVLKPKAKANVHVPYWKSGRAYGDPTHQWPPMSDFSLFYLRRGWRMGGWKDANGVDQGAQAPHTDASNVKFGYDCDFDVVPSYGLSGEAMGFSQDRLQHEVTHHVEVALDLLAVLTKIPKP